MVTDMLQVQNIFDLLENKNIVYPSNQSSSQEMKKFQPKKKISLNVMKKWIEFVDNVEIK